MINAWESAGFPLLRGERAVMSMDRQVRIAAGAMVLLGLMAGVWVHPLAFAVSCLVGAGLIYSGVTNTCDITRLLAKMPWNN